MHDRAKGCKGNIWIRKVPTDSVNLITIHQLKKYSCFKVVHNQRYICMIKCPRAITTLAP